MSVVKASHRGQIEMECLEHPALAPASERMKSDVRVPKFLKAAKSLFHVILCSLFDHVVVLVSDLFGIKPVPRE